MMNEKFLIRMIDYETDYMIRSFLSKNITELLNLYLVVKEKEIQIDICPPGESDNEDKYSNKFAYVKDIRIVFGDDLTFTCLNIYVDVMY